MIKVWGRKTSSNVQVVMWALAELGLENERLDVGGAFGGTDTAEYLDMNPNGLVPTLKDGDSLAIWESTAIVRYLLAKYGAEDIYPADPAVRSQGDMWADWAKGSLASVLMYRVFWSLIRTKAADRNADDLAAGVEDLSGLMGKMEPWLKANEFVSGESLGYGDLIFGHLLYRYFTLDFARADLPAIEAYYSRLCDRPAYRNHVMVSYDSLRVK